MPNGIPFENPRKTNSGNQNNYFSGWMKSDFIGLLLRGRNFIRSANLSRKLTPGAIRSAGVMAATIIGAFAFPALAQGIIEEPSKISTLSLMLDRLAEFSLGSAEVILLALFGGAMSFAMMAAFWLIRERIRVVD